MASDTDTKKTENQNHNGDKARWFRLAPVRPDLPEFDHLLDFYWGGPERRITGITLRIIAVNAITLLILMFGMLYLGQYQNNLINARLQTFETELNLISTSLSEKEIPNTNLDIDANRVIFKNLEKLASRFAKTSRQRIRIFNTQGTLILDTRTLPDHDDRLWALEDRKTQDFHSIKTLKKMMRFIIDLLPEHQSLPTYPENTEIPPGLIDALNKQITLSAWQNKQGRIILSAAAPLLMNEKPSGAILLTHESTEIEQDISRVWIDVLKIFSGALAMTILLSIYLSGVIARPLKKLANAAENVRRGQARSDDIPDLSHRHDEIGELSLALRQMTSALWNRMDSIERFAADVAHELKNPLTSLNSAIETASIVKKTSDRKKLMDIIKHDVQRLDRLISDISNASRIDSELSREAFEKINLHTLLTTLLETYAANPLERSNGAEQDWTRSIQTPKATIELHNTQPKNIFVWGLESRLAQVFQNLLSNALSFCPADSKITVNVTPLATKVHITIDDEGPGIPENKMKTIFERFYSERPQHEHYGQHSGLGLSICRQIIEAHGGQIFAENIYGPEEKPRGARFTVILNKI
ncbi:MAG TPA: ATP-binding protein [Alphaproteobacteria bacterium]|nr:MAG: sensor N-terminal transmembrane domain-containing protein [Rhodospirillales bacterium]HOO81205.1 ATP-binding protein [Alphaproteobacteria bacterium]